jgi:hypothetical protein
LKTGHLFSVAQRVRGESAFHAQGEGFHKSAKIAFRAAKTRCTQIKIAGAVQNDIFLGLRLAKNPSGT